jgi:hypothetical protein
MGMGAAGRRAAEQPAARRSGRPKPDILCVVIAVIAATSGHPGWLGCTVGSKAQALSTKH